MVCVFVCLLVAFVRPAKTAEPIEMPIGVYRTLVGPRNRALGWVEIPTGGEILGVVQPIEKHSESMLWRFTQQKNQ